MKHLSSQGGLTVRDAISMAEKLINARCNTPKALSHLSLTALQDMGVESEELRKRAVFAFKGKRAAGLTSANLAIGPNGESRQKRRREDDDEALSREYGNVAGPDEKSAKRSAKNGIQATINYVFNEIMDEDALKGRYADVNRAPVMTVWATILLERLAFSRAEALSLAHCYVNYTSTMRGISLGIIPASERDKAENKVGPNQPHFELMGVKIPVMQLRDGTCRGISSGEIVGPERAFHYMRRSMAQTLPNVFGVLTLLADSFIKPPSEGDASAYGAEYLNSQDYNLYADFRPLTSGEWGKKGRLWYDKILALRRGNQQELENWREREVKLEEGGQAEEEWCEDVKRLVKEEMERDEQEAETKVKEEAKVET